MTDLRENRRILIVDDDPVNLEILEELLEDYETRTAESGEQALDTAEEFRPELVLLDIMMPGMNGYEVCREIRQNPRLRHTKVLLVSAKAMSSERLAGYEAGADDYITKPFDGEELLAKVRVYLRLVFSEEMDKLKGDLLGILAHEIHTPLSGIIPAGEVLGQAGQMDEQQRVMWGQMILQCGQRLHRLTESGLLLCQLRSSQYNLNCETVDMRHLIDTGIEAIRSSSPDTRFELAVSGAEFEAVVDRNLMQRVVIEMLDNAVRFGPEETPIDVSLICADGKVKFSVLDHGPGVADEVLDAVFQVFTSRIIESEVVGAGLSMALAQAIMQAHGGSIDVQSSTDAGAKFSAEFPAQVGSSA